jgi:hypothetical protein
MPFWPVAFLLAAFAHGWRWVHATPVLLGIGGLLFGIWDLWIAD